MQYKIPNFFIVGAPKSGTTALYFYLKEHPNIFLIRKELHYFATDFKGRLITNLEDYLNLFKNCNKKHLAVGEASVWYLYSKIALKNIYKFNSKAKIIVMLRNPVDLIYSKHSQMVYNCEENEEDFKKAWYLQYERKKGKFLPKNIINPEFLYYEEIGKLGEQIERLYNIFPKEQVHIILFDDFVKNTKYMYEKVLKFLDLPLLNKKEFIVINSNKAHRFKSIGNLLQKPPKILFKSIHFIEDLLGIEQLWPIDLIRKLNTKKIDRKPLDPNFRRELISVFESDIKKLEKLINKDLSFWLK